MGKWQFDYRRKGKPKHTLRLEKTRAYSYYLQVDIYDN